MINAFILQGVSAQMIKAWIGTIKKVWGQWEDWMKSHSKENMLKALVSIKDVPGSELMTQLSTLRQSLNIF